MAQHARPPAVATDAWLSRAAGANAGTRACSSTLRPMPFRRLAEARINWFRPAGTWKRIGIPVRLFSPWTDRLEAARLLHLFGMSREGLELARVAKARGGSGSAIADFLV